MSSPPTSSSSGNDGRDDEIIRWGAYEGPSRSRQRANNDAWPEPFVETLAIQAALDASRLSGRLASAAALANLFQVCSTWRAVSYSDYLWARLNQVVWGRTRLVRATWREEYIYNHRTARNFGVGEAAHYLLSFNTSDADRDPDALICRRLVLSDRYLACGFGDGSVRLFDLQTHDHIHTFRSEHRYRLGRFSRAVSGIILNPDTIVFATLDGHVHTAPISGAAPTNVIHTGNIVEDGALLDFSGCSQWWVGLFAGAPGRAFHVWDAVSRVRTFVGGSLTDPEAVIGWRTLTELTEFVGRVRVVSGEEMAVACTRSGLVTFDLRRGLILGEEEQRRILVGSFDLAGNTYLRVDARGVASVRRVGDMGEVVRFNTRAAARRADVVASRNLGYALIWSGSMIRVYSLDQRGEFLYRMRERIAEVNALVADERHVAAAGGDTWVHLWDFGV